MGAGAKGFSEVAGEGTDVSAFGAGDPDPCLGKAEGGSVSTVDAGGCGAARIIGIR